MKFKYAQLQKGGYRLPLPWRAGGGGGWGGGGGGACYNCHRDSIEQVV